MSTDFDAQKAELAAALIESVFAGVDPHVVGAALAQLLAKLIAGHRKDNRERELQGIIDLTRDLIPLTINEIHGGNPPEGWEP